ncbi:MAG: hypothetical protein ACYS9Y_13610, partial [Planctomycetota bacterium]
MKTTLSNKQKWFNKINITADDELYVGIDVHKKSYHIALWLNNAPAGNFILRCYIFINFLLPGKRL